MGKLPKWAERLNEAGRFCLGHQSPWYSGYRARMDPNGKPDLSTYSSSEPIEIDGNTYRGIRFFTGTDELRQEVPSGICGRSTRSLTDRAMWAGCGASPG